MTYLKGFICTNLKYMYTFGTIFVGNYRLYEHRGIIWELHTWFCQFKEINL